MASERIAQLEAMLAEERQREAEAEAAELEQMSIPARAALALERGDVQEALRLKGEWALEVQRESNQAGGLLP